MRRAVTRGDAISAIRALHARVDDRADALAALHADRLQCRRGCCGCCIDDLAVLPIEAQRIRASHAPLLRSAAPHPRGACAFLGSDGECRIYADRPYVCRTQGLPQRWLSERSDGEIVEGRDICPLNADGPPLAALEDGDCWLIGPVELELANLQAELGDPDAARIPLRSLFERTDSGSERTDSGSERAD